MPGRGDALLIGLQAFIPRKVPIAAGHSVVDAGYGQAESGAWYLVRWPMGVTTCTRSPGPSLSRWWRRAPPASPFPGEDEITRRLRRHQSTGAQYRLDRAGGVVTALGP